VERALKLAGKLPAENHNIQFAPGIAEEMEHWKIPP
jgi:hypothetical protein